METRRYPVDKEPWESPAGVISLGQDGESAKENVLGAVSLSVGHCKT